jgi:hypothetical protein
MGRLSVTDLAEALRFGEGIRRAAGFKLLLACENVGECIGGLDRLSRSSGAEDGPVGLLVGDKSVVSGLFTSVLMVMAGSSTHCLNFESSTGIGGTELASLLSIGDMPISSRI